MFRSAFRILVAFLILSPSLAAGIDSGGLLQLTPAGVDFGGVNPGTIVQKDIEVVHRGESAFILSSVAVEGENADQFRLNNRCPATLFPGGSCLITVDFHPSRNGPATARVVVRTPQFEEIAVLDGTGSAEETLVFDPGTVDFRFSSGTDPADLLLAAGNGGTIPLLVTGITPPPPPFSVVSDSCTGRTLPAGSNCFMELRFAPEAPGTYSGNMVLNYQGTTAGSAAVPVTGTRSAPPSTRPPNQSASPGSPDLKVSTELLDFGPVTTGREQQRSITVRNLGTGAGSIGSLTLPSEPFTVVEDGCSGRQIGPGGICRVAVRIAPAVTGLVQGALDIPTGTQGIFQVRLSAQGVDLPVPAIVVRDRIEWEEDHQLPFGERFLGRSVVTTLTVANIGSAPLTIPEEGVRGALAPPFFLRADNCSGKNLPPAGECSIQLRFAPFTPGVYGDSIELLSDDPRFPVLGVQMSGTGMIAPGNSPPTAPALIHPDPDRTSLRDTVTFRWTPCSDPDGDVVFYQLFLSRTGDFTAVESRLVGVPEGFRLAGFGAASLGLLAGVGLSSRRRKLVIFLVILTSLLVACGDKDEEDNVVLEIGNLERLTTYHWKVMSDDGRGGLAESESRSFTTR